LNNAEDNVEGLLVNKVGRRIFFAVDLGSLFVIKGLVQKDIIRVLYAKFDIIILVKIAEIVENVKCGRYLNHIPAQILRILCENRHVARAFVELDEAWYSLVRLGHTTDLRDSGSVISSVTARGLCKDILDGFSLIANREN